MSGTWLLALLAAVVAAGTVAGGDGEGENRERNQRSGVGFEVVVDEAMCGVDKPLRTVIRDEAAWVELWAEIHRAVDPVPERPEVDFSREMLVVVAMGTRRSGGFDISVRDITATDGGLEVTVQESAPPPGAMVGMSLTQPVEVVRVDSSDQEVIFVDAEAKSIREH
jgi:hypothetical protein